MDNVCGEDGKPLPEMDAVVLKNLNFIGIFWGGKDGTHNRTRRNIEEERIERETKKLRKDM